MEEIIMEKEQVIKVEDEGEEEEVDMKSFVKDIKDMQSRMKYATSHVHEQDQRLVGVNEKLDNYNKKVKKGEEYTDIVNKGVFSYLKDRVVGIFKSDQETLPKNDKKIIEKAKNTKIEDKKDYELTLKEDKDTGFNIVYKDEVLEDKKNVYDDDDNIIEEAINEVKELRNCTKEFKNAVKESSKLVDVTDKNMDIALNNVNKANKKMKKAY